MSLAMTQASARGREPRMPIVLHRFPLSHFSEKGRALLDFKGLDYSIVDHQLGWSQWEVYRLSGQRKVPVVEHDGTVVNDSTEIGLYLERVFPDERRLLPREEQKRRDVLELEARIDRIFGGAAPVPWFASLTHNPGAVAELLTIEVSGVRGGTARLLERAIGGAMRLPAARRFAMKSEQATRQLLRELSDRLAATKFLVGDEPTFADVAAAGLAFHLKFPRSEHLAVPGLMDQGVAGLSDDAEFSRFFDWRDRFYEDFLH